MSSSGLEGALDGIGAALVLLLVALPLAIWKAIEIIIWLVKHISIEVTR